MAEELALKPNAGSMVFSSPPKNWENKLGLRLFISHLAKDKTKATRLRDCLTSYGIMAFVAHEDIQQGATNSGIPRK